MTPKEDQQPMTTREELVGHTPEPERLSYTQFAARHGLVTDYDVQSHIHGGLRAAHMPRSYHRNFQKRLAELQGQRDEGIRKYEAAIAAGEIARPIELSSLERLEISASGDPDMPSTQAARRVLARMAERALRAEYYITKREG